MGRSEIWEEVVSFEWVSFGCSNDQWYVRHNQPCYHRKNKQTKKQLTNTD